MLEMIYRAEKSRISLIINVDELLVFANYNKNVIPIVTIK